MEVFGTKFEQRVWKFLETIGYGKTVSYSKIANYIASTSPHAVSTAVGKIPLYGWK